MIPRFAASRIAQLMRGFPVITVTGPRQSGKTTLVKSLASNLPYISLEATASREFARTSPADFLRQYPNGAVIDEAQHAPELFSEIQSVVDSTGRMGQFILTGSQNLSLLSNVAQSLAGRSAVVELLPLSIGELRNANRLAVSYEQQIVQGFFPAIYSRDLDSYDWLQSYLITYAERDARALAAIADLSAFQRFLCLVAARTGQLLNVQNLASDTGVSDKTAKHWLTILEACYLIHYLRPHFSNFGKRMVKQAKIYMTDVGLACTLLGIRTAEQLQTHPLRGALFETMSVNELLKNRWNAGERQPLWFWRDNIGTEVDVIIERGNELAAIEIKSGITVASDAFSNLNKWRKYAKERGNFSAIYPAMVYGGDTAFVRDGVDIKPWHAL